MSLSERDKDELLLEIQQIQSTLNLEVTNKALEESRTNEENIDNESNISSENYEEVSSLEAKKNLSNNGKYHAYNILQYIAIQLNFLATHFWTRYHIRVKILTHCMPMTRNIAIHVCLTVAKDGIFRRKLSSVLPDAMQKTAPCCQDFFTNLMKK